MIDILPDDVAMLVVVRNAGERTRATMIIKPEDEEDPVLRKINASICRPCVAGTAAMAVA